MPDIELKSIRMLLLGLMKGKPLLMQKYMLNLIILKPFYVYWFVHRFILSLATCKNCIVVDDELNVLPLSSHIINLESITPRPKEESLTEFQRELAELKQSLQDTQPVGVLANICKTLDQVCSFPIFSLFSWTFSDSDVKTYIPEQAKALLKFIDAISEKTLRSTVSLTAARGRGKSAALGLAIAGAVAFGYSNIFVTSPSPENLKTLFQFILKGEVQFLSILVSFWSDYPLHSNLCNALDLGFSL